MELFGARARACSQYLRKGSPVVVEAELFQHPLQQSDVEIDEAQDRRRIKSRPCSQAGDDPG